MMQNFTVTLKVVVVMNDASNAMTGSPLKEGMG